MTEDVFKAPKTKRSPAKQDQELYVSPTKRRRTKEDFYAFCSWVLSYTQYDSQKQEELRAQNNVSPVGSGGSAADSYTSDSTASLLSTSSIQDSSNQDIIESDDESWDLITCHCLKPYAGRPMIECSECQTWIHLSCAKIRKSNIPDTFICQQCREAKFTTRKSTRIRTESKRISI